VRPPIEGVTCRTADGLALDGELRVPDAPWAAAVLLHPHPRFGGDMRSAVPSHLFDALPAAGVAALRFDFRGVGRSEGAHGSGLEERADAVAAIDVLHPLVEGLPLVLAGWSFGGDVALGVDDARLAGWFTVAAPLRVLPSAEDYVAARDVRPKLLAVPEHDQYRGPDGARRETREWRNTTIEVVNGADHFVGGRLDRVAELALSFLRALAAPPA
jgi:alpha/beta superfamily hydrolase